MLFQFSQDWFSVVVLVLEIELRASCLPGKHSITILATSPVLLFLVYFSDRVSTNLLNFAQIGLKPAILLPPLLMELEILI
jgi:hypothetical protein